jgi:hypothetical protein
LVDEEVVVRRPAAALLGTVAGTVLLVGAKYGTAAPRVDDASTAAEAGATEPGGDQESPAAAGSAGLAPSARPGGSAGPPASSRAPGGPAGGASPAPGRTGGAPTTAPACTSVTGNASTIVAPGVGAVTVTIQVCGGAVTAATGSQSRSNWDVNPQAVRALNTLAVRYYKSDISKVHYSGATLTSNAYQASLRSALGKAGL